MLGALLKQLVPALGRYVRYRAGHGAGPVGRGKVLNDSTPVNSTGEPKPVPSDGIGLDAKYLLPVQWPCFREDTPPQAVTSNALYQLWTTIPGGHKWTHYFPIYQAIFGPRRSEPLRILEIGILRGASVNLWRSYFDNPATVIVGIDILPECSRLEDRGRGIRVRIGSQADPAFLRKVVKEFGPFDLIIDDGSHHSSHIITSFNHLFLNALDDDGMYFVEDLHANYWHPWRDSEKSFLDVCKEMMEHMHAHYRSAPPAAFMIEKASDQPFAALSVPRITAMIGEIRIFDSIVAIQKSRRKYVPHYLRTDEKSEGGARQ